ncbi:methyltransferase domain-containing protein [Paraglaciecola sp.]|uniref:methyltransferase domain-containing protein n=1 Tax=Paraglaciecola sp. TaxID=1920173 RepID=UPI003EF728EB
MIPIPSSPSTPCVKGKIARQFSRAAEQYDNDAHVQELIAQDAFSYISQHADTLLDIGCGTGRNSQVLTQYCEHLMALDLAFGMVSYAQKSISKATSQISWLQGDAEYLPLQNRSVNSVFSSMVLQWCNDQNQVMAEISRVLKPQGKAILAIMCEGSFVELNQSWRQLDKHKHVNDFASVKRWQSAALQQGLKVTYEVKPYVTWHADLRGLLASIKSIGANVVLPTQESDGKKRFNRHTLQNLETVYSDLFAQHGQLPLTYQVCYLQCEKP